MAKKEQLVATRSLKFGGRFHAPGEEIAEKTLKGAGAEALKAARDAGQISTRREYEADSMSDAARESLDQVRARADKAEARVAELEAKIEELEGELAAAAKDQKAGSGGGSGGAGAQQGSGLDV